MERMATTFHLCKVSAVLHLSMKSTWVSPEDLLEPRNHVVYPFSFCHHFFMLTNSALFVDLQVSTFYLDGTCFQSSNPFLSAQSNETKNCLNWLTIC